MCHYWFRIDYFRLNLHLIIEILAHICWRSEFIIVRSSCWEITRNNSLNYFKFCPVFDKDCLHFWKGDASVPPPWQVPIYNNGEVKIYVYRYAHFRHIDNGSQWANEQLWLIIVLFSFSLPLNFGQFWYDLKGANVCINDLVKFLKNCGEMYSKLLEIYLKIV